jgi:hypothetical protein
MSYQQKYLKYKEKYLNLKNQLNQIGGANTFYDLTGKNVYFYSDEESGAPFIFNTVYPASKEKGVDTQLNGDFVFSNGLITGFKNDATVIGFLGDLLDNGKYSIRSLEAYINLKNAHPERVILIGGNRDFNKIRMGIELSFEDNIKQGLNKLPWHGTTDIQSLLARLTDSTFNFRFRSSVPDYLKNVGLWNAITNIDASGTSILERDYNNVATPFHSRLDAMFRKTKGIGGYKFIVDELNDLLPGNNFTVGDEITAKFVCAIQMVMAFNWTDEELPEYLRRFNGLYIKYLELAHIIALFKINNKFGVLSHSGIPQKTTNSKFAIDKRLTSPFGYDWNNTQMNFKAGTLKNVLSGIEKEKIKLINEVQNKKMNTYESDSHKGIYASTHATIDKFIHLTAGTTFTNGYGAKSENSPVVWGLPIKTNQRTDISYQIGSGVGYSDWMLEDSKYPNKLYADTEGGEFISYNIFGHTPQYFNPSVYRDQQTLHINLDVSKIEANQGNNNSANNYSFTFFYINGSTKRESLLGRIKFPEIPEGDIASLLFTNPKETLRDVTIRINGLNEATKKDPSKKGENDALIQTENAKKPVLVSKIYNGCAYMDENAIRFIKENPIYYYNKELPVEGTINISLEDNIIDTPLKCINYPPLDFTKYIWHV